MTRPFKSLPLSSGPDTHYDVIVIGAGVGGLVCANLLAKARFRVLLVEQHYMVGGYCSTFRRKGFTFDAGSHFYPLLGNPTTMTGKLLAEIGVKTGWCKMNPVDRFHFPDGSQFEVSADFDTYLADLKRLFPHETTALDRFFQEVREAYYLGLLAYFRGRETERMAPYKELTVRDVLDRHFQDQKLKLLLTGDCPHWGGPPERTSFIFDSMLRLSYFLGNYYPSGGSQAFADTLAARLNEQGGDLAMKTSVSRILVEEERVAGVEVETGPRHKRRLQKVSAPVVVSGADILQTVDRMLPAAYASFADGFRNLRVTYPCFLVHIGVRDVDTAQLEQVHGYYWDGWNPDRVGVDALRFKIFVPTLFEPDMAPPGCHVIILQKVLAMDYDEVKDWDSHKTAIEKQMLAWLEGVIPGISEKIVVGLGASAKTSHRFTANLKGAMLGWEMSPQQLGSQRPDVVGPVENLFFTGHWTRPGGGITPVMISAKQVADRIIGLGGCG